MFQNRTLLANEVSLAPVPGATAAQGLAERRLEHRPRMFKGAVVRHASGLISVEAAVRDMTAKGARVKLAEAHLLPRDCELQLSGEKRSRRMRVVWTTSSEAGLAFA